MLDLFMNIKIGSSIFLGINYIHEIILIVSSFISDVWPSKVGITVITILGY